MFDHSPTVGSYKAEPYTVNELDAHPDADRIWATIEAMKERHEKLKEDIDYQIREAADEAFAEGQYDGADEVMISICNALRGAELHFQTDEKGNITGIGHYLCADPDGDPWVGALEEALDEFFEDINKMGDAA